MVRVLVAIKKDNRAPSNAKKNHLETKFNELINKGGQNLLRCLWQGRRDTGAP